MWVLHGSAHARGIVCRCVDRSACLALFPRGDDRDRLGSQAPRSTRDCSWSRVSYSILRSGGGVLPSIHFQSVVLGDLLPPCALLAPIVATSLSFRQFSIEVAFEFIVEDNSEIRPPSFSIFSDAF